MSDIAIRCESLGKKYQIGGPRERYKALRDTLADAMSAPFRKVRAAFQGSTSPSKSNNTIWALKDVSFEVKRGEVVGIIGRNGAGKSTLLKVLSRITKPSEGLIEIRGRVGSLLEVGTGFHPELTGRENIYLNGVILGMRKAEINRKFDEIVAFAEVDKFIDTPVKRYSSGMYVRLAFAVAAHLELDTLLVDEVLAVGDAAFQKKCLGKMDDVARQGRTVLFVSHNMSSIQRLCPQSALFEGGKLIAYESTTDNVIRYLSSSADAASPNSWIDVSQVSRVGGTGAARFVGINYNSLNKAIDGQPYSNGPLEVSLDIVADSSMSVDSVAVVLYDNYGTILVNADTVSLGRITTLQQGHNILRFRIESLHLKPGVYVLGLWLANTAGDMPDILDFLDSALRIEVVNVESDGFGSDTVGAVTCHFDISKVKQL